MTGTPTVPATLLKAPSLARFLLAALLVPVVLGGLVLWLRSEYSRSEHLRQEAARSFDQRMEQLVLLSHLKDAERAQRGFLLTGDPRFLGPYEPSRREIARHLADLSTTRDLPPDYFPALHRLVREKFAELDRGIAHFRAKHVTGDRSMVTTGTDRRIMRDLRVLIDGRIAAEAAQSSEQLAVFLAYRNWLERVVYAVVAILIVTLFATLSLLWRLRRQRYDLLLGALESGGRHATILDSTIDAILILNPSGTVESVNAAATRMLGFRSGELERRDIATILDLWPGEGTFHTRVGLVDGRLQRSFLPDRSVRHRDGHAVPVDVAVGVMNVPSGVHLVVSLRDIAERKRIERVKDDLISTVSHELRTPLTSVVGALGLLRAGAAGAMAGDAARLVEIADNNSRRLIRLINDMLDIDRIESGKLAIERTPLDLRTVVENACAGSEGLVRAGDITLACNEVPHPVIVAGDADRLVQVVTNLVSNAARVSPVGSTVSLSLFTEDERAILVVEDRGSGIPPAFRERVFGRFERATPNDGTIGTGLGLAISREIVVRHGGTIWFEDRAGGGTRFAVSLPLAGQAVRRDADAPAVLVCEEDDRIAAELIAIVVAEGCAHHRVRSADEASEALAVRSYSALLVSLTLPEEGGLAFAHAARDGDPPFDGPIVVVAASAIDDGDGPIALDVVDWIGKPIAPERLGQALRSALARTSARLPVILHLDDDRDLLDVVAASIEPEARIVAATDLASARALLQDVSPDVAILDLRLADGSGLDLIPFLVDADGLAVPTIIYSAEDVPHDDAQRVDAVLVKARGSIPDLKATIRRIVRLRARRP